MWPSTSSSPDKGMAPLRDLKQAKDYVTTPGKFKIVVR